MDIFNDKAAAEKAAAEEKKEEAEEEEKENNITTDNTIEKQVIAGDRFSSFQATEKINQQSTSKRAKSILNETESEVSKKTIGEIE